MRIVLIGMRMEHFESSSYCERAKQGDVSVFTTLLRSSDEKMRALAYRLVQDRTAMEDVLQASYLKAYRGLASFRGDSAFESWLYSIVYRSCLDHLKQSKSNRAESLDSHGHREAASPTNPGDVDLAADVADRLTLEDALAKLPVEQRAAVWLVDAQGFSFGQAAEVLDLPTGTVGSRVSRGRRSLRAALGQTSDKEAQT